MRFGISKVVGYHVTQLNYHAENDYPLNYLGCSRLWREKLNSTVCSTNIRRRKREILLSSIQIFFAKKKQTPLRKPLVVDHK